MAEAQKQQFVGAQKVQVAGESGQARSLIYVYCREIETAPDGSVEDRLILSVEPYEEEIGPAGLQVPDIMEFLYDPGQILLGAEKSDPGSAQAVVWTYNIPIPIQAEFVDMAVGEGAGESAFRVITQLALSIWPEWAQAEQAERAAMLQRSLSTAALAATLPPAPTAPQVASAPAPVVGPVPVPSPSASPE